MSTRIVYVGIHDEVDIAATGQRVARGQEVEIEDPDLAASLLDQDGNWARPTSNAAKEVK